ncbi:PQQ-binding-like beta-propeller repeat protein [Paraliomyxa miuraensis]|uniref:PQQ-binding-like beta-propeller repeat protein n=1 Tax=Paraliomyxa miuraensis TaxID=376150 RepID=UPI00225384BD|nr:PQQ-binding-like beta-propeller repeat protein [Paraliomyxa miuraensis]MCX4243385.1 PQQ-binding-like beta-propeller repeat protein [Paraliomyxa miuraensis]
MSKQVTRLVRLRGVRQAVRGVVLGGLLGGLLGGTAGCHPEASMAQYECRTDDDCGDGGQCHEGRCKGHGMSPVRAAATPTASPESPEAAKGSESKWLGPTVAPRQQWAVDLGAVISATPTIVVEPEGRVVAYVGSHAGRFVGVVVEGPEAGRVVLDLMVDGIIWSTAVADERGWLYFGADDDRLRAVDPKAGVVAWSRRLGGCEPTRAPGPVGVRCDVDGGPSLGPGGDLYAGADGLYRVAGDGTIRWHYPPEEEGPGAHVATTPLVTAEGVVFGNQGKEVVALDHEGRRRWSVTFKADVDGSPVLGRDGTIYVGVDEGALHAIRPDGTIAWSAKVGAPIRARAAVGSDGVVVFGAYDGILYAVEPDGGVRWRLPTGAEIHAPATIDPAGRIFVGSRDEQLYALDLEGHVYWTLEMPAQLDGAVALSPGGTLVVGCDDGVLRGLR